MIRPFISNDKKWTISTLPVLLVTVLGVGWMGIRPGPVAVRESETRAVARLHEPAAAEAEPGPIEAEAERLPLLALAPAPPKMEEKLPESEQASLQRAIFTAMHAVEPLTEEEAALPHNEGVSHFATNRGQKFQARFLQDGGVRLSSSLPERSWQGTLRVEPAEAENLAAWQASGTRAERSAGSALTEWYENRAEGLEHGFTLHARPEGAEASYFTLELAVDGLRVEEDRRPLDSEDEGAKREAGEKKQARSTGDLVFSDPATQEPLLAYRSLKVWDATGKPLPAAMHPTARGFRFTVQDDGAAYPVTIDPVLVSLESSVGSIESKTRKLIGVGAGFMGYSVALDGDTVVVGAPYTDSPATNSGAAYVFTRGANGWDQQAKLTASDGAAEDQFGWSVGISGNTVIVGAPYADASKADSGAVYVFVRNNAGAWSFERKLVGEANEGDQFGGSVAISGDNAVIGARYHDGAGEDAGAAYVFHRNGPSWARQNLLIPPDASAVDQFGWSVAIDGSLLVVGSPGDDDLGSLSGSAYVYRQQSNGFWTQQAKLTDADGREEDQFGMSVGVSGNTIVVGAPYGIKDTNSTFRSGTVCIFVRDVSGAWTRQFRSYRPFGSEGDYYGRFVGVSGDYVIIGAFGHDLSTSQTDAGSADVLFRTGSTWRLLKRLTAADAAKQNYYGTSVAISGTTAMVGSPGAVGSAGAVYAIDLSLPDDHFGLHVDVDGDVAVVGALDHDTAGASNAGAAWVVRRNNLLWRIEQRLAKANPAAQDRFGVAVGVSGNRIAVGADFDDEAGLTNCGSVTVFEYANNRWSPQYTFNGLAGGSNLGRSVAIDGDYVAAGAVGVGSGHGQVLAWWLFKPYPDTWDALRRTINPPFTTQAGACFGFSVALSGGRLVVGSPGFDYQFAGSPIAFSNCGRVDFFTLSTSGPELLAQHVANYGNQVAQGGLGFSVAIYGDIAAAGGTSPAGWFTGSGANVAGSAFAFTYQDGKWSTGANGTSGPVVLSNAGFTAAHHFGSSVAVSGSVIAVGAFGGETQIGGVRLFRRQGAQWVSDLGDNHIAPGETARPGDHFGISTALSGDTLVVGAYEGEDYPGAAYVYRVGSDNPASTMLSISIIGPSAGLSWPPNTGLMLWRSPNMAPGSWTKVPYTESTTSYFHPLSNGSQMFFRLAPP